MNELFTKEIPHGANYTLIASKHPDLGYLDRLVEKMIQQSPQNRFASIDDIKKELQARKNEFVERQKLDAMKRQVVPVSTPSAFEPIKLIDVDPRGNELIFVLDRAPDREWVELFKYANHEGSWTMGYEAQSFSVTSGRQITKQMYGNDPQQAVNHFKRYLEYANKNYPILMAQSAQRIEAEQKAKLARKIAEEEKRQQVKQSLKW